MKTSMRPPIVNQGRGQGRGFPTACLRLACLQEIKGAALLLACLTPQIAFAKDLPTAAPGQVPGISVQSALPTVSEVETMPEDPPAIVVQAPSPHTGADPIEPFNQTSYAAVQKADRLLIAPLAMTYQRVLPHPIRSGVHNVLDNLREPVVIANTLLQHRIGKAGRTLARLAINSTLGLGGLIDVAKRKPFRIPYRSNGFGNTLGFYGLKPGPYMYLPVVGATTVRDLIGTVADRMFLSTLVGAPFTRPAYRIPVIVLGTLDDRLVNDEHIQSVRTEQSNPYLATRDAYLAARASEIEGLHHKDP